MIYRIYPSTDTFITNYRYLGVARTGSNFGSSEVLNLWRQAPISGTYSTISGSLARILMKFDLSEVNSLTGSGVAPSSGISYFLRLKDAQHIGTLPTSYDVEVERLSQSFDEGNGVDVQYFSDLGFCNWDKAKSNVFWSVTGSVGLTPQIISTQHFDNGHEDLLVDVTPQVNSWLTGNIPNNGFLVRLSSTLEAGNTDYFYKQFFSKETKFPDYLPYLEARWDDSLKDDRNDFIFNTTGSLYLYNVIRGQYQDLSSNNVYVKITDISGSFNNFLTGTKVSTGVYSASFALATGSYSGSLFYDVWFSGSNVFTTGTFGIGSAKPRIVSRPKQYFVNITNLRNSYQNDEKTRLTLFVQSLDYSPAVVTTASVDFNGEVINKAYYRITNDRTKEVVVPFGTGSVETTRLSYDQAGNFFDFYMKNLSPGNLYRITFLFDVDGQRQIIDKGFKFKVTNVI